MFRLNHVIFISLNLSRLQSSSRERHCQFTSGTEANGTFRTLVRKSGESRQRVDRLCSKDIYIYIYEIR